MGLGRGQRKLVGREDVVRRLAVQRLIGLTEREGFGGEDVVGRLAAAGALASVRHLSRIFADRRRLSIAARVVWRRTLGVEAAAPDNLSVPH